MAIHPQLNVSYLIKHPTIPTHYTNPLYQPNIPTQYQPNTNPIPTQYQPNTNPIPTQYQPNTNLWTTTNK